MKIKHSLISVTVATAAFWGVNASADGVGGVAGSAAFHLSGTGPSIGVSAATVAGAVGKDSAYAGSTAPCNCDATTSTGSLESFALGTGGAITFTGTNAYITSVTQDTDRGTAQANTITAGQVVDFNASDGTFDINNP
ncbi:hypothetical protein PN36_21485 [Candidatus Thiomargarita nelsonii]|uniref:Secreted protein n=1 Tax=Candidatus Thiomargarita nelsonii TaxID=1003181 RepID=A0A0A6PM35_9GAMM|nr:hypothetical protein PN36_21485 [Candidatus Thiomargarita nelsonii]